MKKTELKTQARKLIMEAIAKENYSEDYNDFVKNAGGDEEAYKIFAKEADRVARLLGFEKSWTY